MGSWHDEYKELDLHNGTISFISEDDEDMIEIRYKDGMLIDVGYIERLNSYVITVVLSDTEEGWKDPLEQITVNNRSELSDKIQDTICKYRQMDYPTFLSELITPVLPFLRELKESRKKLGIGAAGIVIMLCIVRGIVQKFIWQGSFWEGFLYQLALLFAIFIISTVFYVLMKKAPKVGSFILSAFIILGIAFLLGVVLLVILLLLNSFLHFWF
jgi:hypothetical protein